MPKSSILHYWRTIVVLISIFLLSILTIPSTSINKVVRFAHIDKVAHLLLYMLLGAVIYVEHKKTQTNGTNKQVSLYVLLFFAIFYGGVIELVQMYLTTKRSGEWLDWVADIVGVIVGMGTGMLFYRKKKNG